MGKSGRGSFAIGPTRRRLGIGPGDQLILEKRARAESIASGGTLE
jgi:hypothetical protein